MNLSIVLRWIFIFIAIITKSIAYANTIVDENQQAGTTDWQLSKPASAREIEGYASHTSVNAGDTINFFVNTSAPSYDFEIFRMGWYQGLGGRRIAGSITLPGVEQFIPIPDSDGLVNCNWSLSYSLNTVDQTTGSNWTSGVYLAKLTASDSDAQSYIIFVVRDDSRIADIAFQLPVTTYQAYNFWGGKSSYTWGSGGGIPWGSTSGTAAKKVSFNRPYARSTNNAAAYGVGAGEFFTNNQPVAQGYPISSAGWDYNMLRWLEREGYDVSYLTNIDTHTSPQLLSNFKAFLSVGHDEYWSWEMRENIENALDNGLNLGFFSANAVYWQIRLIDDPVNNASNRIIEIFKDRNADPFFTDGDPGNDHLVTVRWRSNPVNLSEDALIGVRYFHDPIDGDIVISNASHPIFNGTGLANGDRLVGLLGYEVDGRSGKEPANTITLAATPVAGNTSHVTIYTASSGAKVFATGSMAWSWGLDDYGSPALRTARSSSAAQKITHNVLAEFGVVLGNAPPIARNDNYSTTPNNSLTIALPGVLTNDSDKDSISAVLRTSTSNGNLFLNADGSFNYTPDAQFTGVDSFSYVADDGELQSAPAIVNINVNDGYRCVRIKALSEINNTAFASAAEFRLLNNNQQLIDQSGWSVYSVDSEEHTGENGAATNAFDNDPGTIWHTMWSNSVSPYPHEIIIDTGGYYAFYGLRYLPRQNGTTNGTIKDYEIDVSSDCESWESAASGSWASNQNEKEVVFEILKPPVLSQHWEMNSSSSNTLLNSISGGGNGVIVGATRVSGKLGNGLMFDGIDDYVQLGLPDINDSWTVAMWVKRGLALTGNAVLLSSTNSALKLEQWPNTGNVGFTEFGVADYQFSYAAPHSQWTHLTFVGNGSQLSLYVNCSFEQTLANYVNLPLSQIGRRSDGVGQLEANLDDLRVFNGALNLSEIQELCSTSSTNIAPTVSAGSDITLTVENTTNLNGTVSDDNLPNPPATVITTWTQVSGPGAVTFTNSNASDTVASFPVSGTYLLRLTANDSLLSSSDDVVVTVNITPNANTLESLTTIATGEWSFVSFVSSYSNPVAVCSLEYTNNLSPVIVRMRNVSSNTMEVRLQSPGGGASESETVYCFVMEAGAWMLPDGRLIEAQRYNNTSTARKGNWDNYESRDYQNSYVKPVVLGQVMSANDEKWSTFWSRGASRTSPPDSISLNTGKQIAEDTNFTRDDEEIGIIIVEEGFGNVNGIAYEASLGEDSISGLNSSPDNYVFSQSFASNPVGIISLSAMDGGNGGWAVLRGPNAITDSQISIAIDEDQIADSERSHTNEQVAFFVMQFSGIISLSVVP